MKNFKAKRGGLGLEIHTFRGKSGTTYTVLRTTQGSFHVLVEVDAKEAALDCGAEAGKNTRSQWQSLWKE